MRSKILSSQAALFVRSHVSNNDGVRMNVSMKLPLNLVKVLIEIYYQTIEFPKTFFMKNLFSVYTTMQIKHLGVQYILFSHDKLKI